MTDFLNHAVYGLRRSAIREYSALAAKTPGCVALTLGEPDFDTPSSVIDTACCSLHHGETHYIANNGDRQLLEKISAFEKEHNGLSYSADEIIVTAGATEGLFVSLFGILNPGDEVIIPTPAFGLYEQIVLMCRGVPVLMDTSQDGFQIRKQKLSQLVNEKTKAIIINTPNNPTGCIYDEESLAAVADVIDGKGMFVICDDVYRQLIYTDDYHSFAERSEYRDQVIVVQSYSKPYAMTGWRMGYLMMPQSIKERLEKMGLSFTVPMGGFYVFPSIEKYGMTSDMFCRRLIEEAKLALTPGSCFGCEGHVRLTYCYEDGALKEGLDRLERFLRKLEGTSL